MPESVSQFFVRFSYEIALGIGVLVVLGAFKRVGNAARNWREITERMATSKKAREHKKLTTFLVRAVNRSPIISALSGIFILVGIATAGATGFLGSFLGEYTGRLSVVEMRAEQAKKDMSALDLKAPEPTVESMRRDFDQEMTSLESSILISKLSLGAMHVVFAAMLLLTAYTFYKGLPDRMTMMPLAVWLDQYATRLFAMCTKDEARLLAILELKVMDEASLRAYLTRLGQLSVQYDFPLLSQVRSWLIESERREREGLV